MLDKATHYENEVDNAVDGLTSMMEPLIMAIWGTCRWSSNCHVSSNFPNGFSGIMQEIIIILFKT
jgi:hypothetical protein